MKQKTNTLRLVFIFLFFVLACANVKAVKTTWGGSAEMVYDTGFMHMLAKSPAGGVSLFNMVLIENDSPGAGRSEKGVYADNVWGKIHARKELFLDDPRTKKAWLVIFTTQQGKTPLQFKVNGHISRVDNWDELKNHEKYRYAEFPAKWLKKGRNEIELFCPEAREPNDGWTLYIARADEFENGGGDPNHVGETSFKSLDGGKSWQQSPFGPERKTKAEYAVRLSLDRFVRTGWLTTPVIDLWRGDSGDFIVPLREIQKMNLSINSDVPQGTRIEYYFRKGTDSQPFSDDWEPYKLIGTGPSLNFEIGGLDLNRRYVQFMARLSTDNPLKSPIVKSLNLTAELKQRVTLHQNIHVVDYQNPSIRYSSLKWEWEKADRPEFKELRQLENLDEVVAGSRTQFDAQVKLLDYVTKRWKHGTPAPEYPAWDALSIINRINNAGAGGFCIQFNNTLGGMCMAFGWQARLVNIGAHEVVEVWNDEFAKWIFLDADHMNHYIYDPQTAEPLSMLELHTRFLDHYFPDRPIDWMTDLIIKSISGSDRPPIKRGSLTNHKGTRMTGFTSVSFLRMVPRNNWYEKPYPRPLNHGYKFWWPWDGYINWYDDRTPPKRQYSWHTDRPRDMWPDLNRVHVDAVLGFGNDRLFLRFETYTPNFSHYEIDLDDTGWKKVGHRWTWLLQSGRNSLRVRAVNKLGAKGKPSYIVLNHADAPFAEP